MPKVYTFKTTNGFSKHRPIEDENSDNDELSIYTETVDKAESICMLISKHAKSITESCKIIIDYGKSVDTLLSQSGG